MAFVFGSSAELGSAGIASVSIRFLLSCGWVIRPALTYWGLRLKKRGHVPVLGFAGSIPLCSLGVWVFFA